MDVCFHVPTSPCGCAVVWGQLLNTLPCSAKYVLSTYPEALKAGTEGQWTVKTDTCKMGGAAGGSSPVRGGCRQGHAPSETSRGESSLPCSWLWWLLAARSAP